MPVKMNEKDIQKLIDLYKAETSSKETKEVVKGLLDDIAATNQKLIDQIKGL